MHARYVQVHQQAFNSKGIIKGLRTNVRINIDTNLSLTQRDKRIDGGAVWGDSRLEQAIIRFLLLVLVDLVVVDSNGLFNLVAL